MDKKTMQELTFQGIRCFSTVQRCPIRPITVLVGENSTGKSTFLSLVRIAWDVAQSEFSEDPFNEEPFLLGAYDQIASYRGGRAGRVKEFSVGACFPLRVSARRSHLLADHCEIAAVFCSSGAQPRVEKWSFASGKLKIEVKELYAKNGPTITVTTDRGSAVVAPKLISRRNSSISRVLRDLSFGLSRARSNIGDLFGEQVRDLTNIIPEEEAEALRFLYIDLDRSLGERPYAFAPIRTRPQRTYDPAKDVPRPEGTHVPMFLAKTYAKKSEEWVRLRQAMNAFGKASGLFQDVEIQRKGSKESDPFQVAIKGTGPAFNLVDVGYGVSQVLPIVVDAIRAAPGSILLLQQPEVHLHPKAQAELATFLCSLAKTQEKTFIIETHSDYFLDRIRLDLRDGSRVTPEDVKVLYFEKKKGRVEIADMDFDANGNLLDAPASYRTFFLNEEKRMLGL